MKIFCLTDMQTRFLTYLVIKHKIQELQTVKKPNMFRNMIQDLVLSFLLAIMKQE